MFRRIFALAVAPVVVALAAFGVMGAANAATPNSINPTIVQTGPADAGGITGPSCTNTSVTHCTLSEAGWYTNQFANLFTQVNGTFSLNAQAEGIGVSTVAGVNGATITSINGAIGLQLCNETNGQAAQLGAVYLGGGQFALGYLVGTLHGLSYNPCVGGGVLGGASVSTTFNTLGLVSVGNSIQAQIRQNGPGVLFSAMIVGGVANYTYFDPTPWFFPNEAGAGVQKNTATLSAPAINDLTDFSNVSAVNDATLSQGGFDNWNAVQVNGSQDGMPPALLTTGGLTDNSGPAVCHRVRVHHHHRHYTIKIICTIPSDVSSSFSVFAGTPVGP